jgi:hypothetical protein
MIKQKTVNKITQTLFILISLNCFSQKVERIKQSDTIYIYFKNESKFEKKYKGIESKSKFYENHLFYSFGVDSYNTLIFTYNDYMDSDKYSDGVKTDIKILKKNFLRKNKNLILDIDFFLKNGFKETFNTILYGKIIYLIDASEIKNRMLKAKQVDVMSNYIEE